MNERHEIVLETHEGIDADVGSVLSLLIEGKEFVALVLTSRPDVDGRLHLVVSPPAGPDPL